MKFEWDPNKNKSNIKKHGISFEKASLIFEGVVMTKIDDRFDYKEVRKVSVGISSGIAILAVVHTDRNDNIRIISARRANKNEKKSYINFTNRRKINRRT